MTPDDDTPVTEYTAEDKTPEPTTLEVQSSRHVPNSATRTP
jgi:hypothetical protein